MRLFLLSSSAIALLAAAPVAAQQTTTQEPTTQEPIPGDIVVTAQRRAERLQDVPVSVTSLSGDQIEKLGLTSPNDLAAQVPNLQVNDVLGAGAPVFSLRGVSMSDYSLNQSSPIAAYVDEVYKGNFALFGVTMFDVDRIEVLRGPQGTLYGKNTTGGAINFITKKPGFETEGFLTAGYGNYNHWTAEGAAQAGLTDTVAARVAFTLNRADGWQKNLTTPDRDMSEIREYGVRGSILFEPNEDWEFVLRGSTSLQNPIMYGIVAAPGEFGIGAGVYGLFNSIDPITNPNLDDFRTGLDNDEIESNHAERRRNRTYGLSLTGNWSASDTLTATSITSWDKGKLVLPEDTDGSALRVLEQDATGRAKQFAEDLRLTSDYKGPFNFILGAYYNREKVFSAVDIGFFQDIDVNFDGSLDFMDCVESAATIGTPDMIFPIGCKVANQFDQKRVSLAAYTDATYEIGNHVKLRGGLRYTHDKADLTNFKSLLLGTDDTPLANLIPGDPLDLDATTSRKLSQGKVTGRLGVDYKTDAGTLIYVSFNRGYRGGAFNAQAFFDPSELTTTKPETLDAAEIGFKTQLLDRRLRINAAAFYYKYRNQQFLDIDPVTAAQLLVNIDRSRIFGAELEIVARPVRALTLTAGLGFLNSKVLEGTLRGIDISGNELPQAPSVSANLAMDWDVVSSSWGTVSLHADTRLVSDQYFEILNVHRLKEDGYGVVNARLGLTSAHKQWDAGLWVKNLTKAFYNTTAIDLRDSFGFDYHHVGDPRTYGVTITRTF